MLSKGVYTEGVRWIFVLILLGAAWAQGPLVYQQNCVFCHGENGLGRLGAFPPLAGHVPKLVATPEGRAQIINTLLYGMQGPIKAKGNNYNGVMPAFARLSDEQLASVLNHVANAWGNDRQLANFRPITPAEIAAARDSRLTPQQNGQNRSRINTP
jgi:mono/diheme cytochrome c family protein